MLSCIASWPMVNIIVTARMSVLHDFPACYNARPMRSTVEALSISSLVETVSGSSALDSLRKFENVDSRTVFSLE